MDNLKSWGSGLIITLLIGGTAYSVNQADVVQNFAADTGFTQEQAEQYVNEVTDDDLVTFNQAGSDYVEEGSETLALASEIDCVRYEYEWESATLSCTEAKAQLRKIGNAEQMLGQSLIKLESDSASESEIRAVINNLDQLNAYYELEVSVAIFDNEILSEMRTTNSYNKSLLKAALESN